MTKFVALSLALIIGALSSVQAMINTELGKTIGGVSAALISFFVGTATLLTLYLSSNEGGLQGITKVKPYLLIGGIFGAMFVFGMIKLIPILGVGSVMAASIAGQLILALIIDQFGWFGATKIGLDWTRGLGAVLLLIGVKLMAK